MPTPSLTFSPATGRYRDTRTGRLVSAAQVRAELDRSLQVTANRVKMLGDDLRAGRVSLNDWRVQMRQAIKDSNLRGAALAQGGWDRMTPESWGRAGQAIRREYQYLEGWVAEIGAGAPLDGRLGSRGALYVAAARNTFHRVQAEEMVKRGYDLEKSVLHPAEHCSQCIAEADAGFRPIGEMVPIGARACLRNCKCSVAYSREAA